MNHSSVLDTDFMTMIDLNDNRQLTAYVDEISQADTPKEKEIVVCFKRTVPGIP